MSTIKEYLLSALTDTMTTVGESKLEAVLQQLHEKNQDEYNAVIAAGKVIVDHLQPLILASGTKIDDALLNALWDAIRSSAKTNNVSLV